VLLNLKQGEQAPRRKRRKSRLNAKFALKTTTTQPRSNRNSRDMSRLLLDEKEYPNRSGQTCRPLHRDRFASTVVLEGTDRLGTTPDRGEPKSDPWGAAHASLIVERNSPPLEPASQQATVRRTTMAR
jgi:hypothetical protein